MDVRVHRLVAADQAATADVWQPGTFASRVVRAGDVCGILCATDRTASPQPGLLVLGGSENGIPRGLAQMVAMLGYPAFAQAYVDPNRSGHPFRHIPVERLERGLELLAGAPCVDPRRLGVIGVSKGGEAALLLATRAPEVRAVIGITASGIMFQNPSKHRAGSWSERGEELPYARFSSVRLAAALLRAGRRHSGGVRFEPLYRAAADNAPADAVIPLERSRAHLLLISGQDDALWPATMLAERAAERAQTVAHQRLAIHLSYPGAGHDLAPPADRETITTTDTEGLALALGGNPEATRLARIDAWEQIRMFLEQTMT